MSAPTNPTDNQQVNTQLDTQIEQCSQSIDAELERANFNFARLGELIARISILSMRRFGRLNFEFRTEHNNLIKIHVQKYKEESRNKWGFAFTIVTATGTALGGVVQLVGQLHNIPQIGERGTQTLKSLVKGGKTVSQLSTGLSPISQLPFKLSDGRQFVIKIAIGYLQDLAATTRQSDKDAAARLQSIQSSSQTAINAHHNAAEVQIPVR